ncbi:MAG TPA: hypothetical protein VGH20_19755, partial [Myxococcales bacterium]
PFDVLHHHIGEFHAASDTARRPRMHLRSTLGALTGLPRSPPGPHARARLQTPGLALLELSSTVANVGQARELAAGRTCAPGGSRALDDCLAASRERAV